MPSIYFDLMNCSTALLSSSPSKGKGTLLGFQSSLLCLLPPLRDKSSKSLSLQRSNDKDLTSEYASSSLNEKTLRWTEAHLPHRKTPKLIEHQVGTALPHSPHLLPFSGKLTRSFNSRSAPLAPADDLLLILILGLRRLYRSCSWNVSFSFEFNIIKDSEHRR